MCRKFETCFVKNLTFLALLLAKKQQKWSMTFWAGTSKETKANQKIWNYSSPNENLKKKKKREGEKLGCVIF